MAEVMPGRFTAQIDGPFVVFRLGIHITRIFLFWRWIPVLIAVVPALRALLRSRAPGIIGGFSIYYLSAGLGIVQYWRSFEDLEQFARSEDNPYLELWRRYRKAGGANGGVGIWYETFLIGADHYEVVYDNMPVIGLAAASKHVAAVGRLETARRRLGGEGEPAVPSPTNPVY
jgi:hypothetical protein